MSNAANHAHYGQQMRFAPGHCLPGERERERERGIYEEGNSMDGDPGKRLVRRRRV